MELSESKTTIMSLGTLRDHDPRSFAFATLVGEADRDEAIGAAFLSL